MYRVLSVGNYLLLYLIMLSILEQSFYIPYVLASLYIEERESGHVVHYSYIFKSQYMSPLLIYF